MLMRSLSGVGGGPLDTPQIRLAQAERQARTLPCGNVTIATPCEGHATRCKGVRMLLHQRGVAAWVVGIAR
jgi:hypothetical protein